MTTGDVVYSLRFSLINFLPEPGFDLGSTAGKSCVLTARLHMLYEVPSTLQSSPPYPPNKTTTIELRSIFLYRCLVLLNVFPKEKVNFVEDINPCQNLTTPFSIFAPPFRVVRYKHSVQFDKT